MVVFYEFVILYTINETWVSIQGNFKKNLLSSINYTVIRTVFYKNEFLFVNVNNHLLLCY